MYDPTTGLVVIISVVVVIIIIIGCKNSRMLSSLSQGSLNALSLKTGILVLSQEDPKNVKDCPMNDV